MASDIVTLRNFGPELPRAQVADQPAAESALCPQDGIDDGIDDGTEHCVE